MSSENKKEVVFPNSWPSEDPDIIKELSKKLKELKKMKGKKK